MCVLHVELHLANDGSDTSDAGAEGPLTARPCADEPARPPTHPLREISLPRLVERTESWTCRVLAGGRRIEMPTCFGPEQEGMSNDPLRVGWFNVERMPGTGSFYAWH